MLVVLPGHAGPLLPLQRFDILLAQSSQTNKDLKKQMRRQDLTSSGMRCTSRV